MNHFVSAPAESAGIFDTKVPWLIKTLKNTLVFLWLQSQLITRLNVSMWLSALLNRDGLKHP